MPKLTPEQDAALLGMFKRAQRENLEGIDRYLERFAGSSKVRRGRQGRRSRFRSIDPLWLGYAYLALEAGRYDPRQVDLYVTNTEFVQGQVGGKRTGLRD